MAAADKKTTYTAAEVAALEDKIQRQQAEIEGLKRKLEHMNEAFANAQRARIGQSSEQKSYVFGKTSSACLTKRMKRAITRLRNPTPIPFSLRHMRGRKNAARPKC